MLPRAVAFVLIALVMPFHAAAETVQEAEANARRAAIEQKEASAALAAAERDVAKLEREIESLKRELGAAEAEPAAAAPTPERTAEDAAGEIEKIENDLRALNEVINKLENDIELDQDDWNFLREIIGSSVPVKVELLQILKDKRAEWQRRLRDLEREKRRLESEASRRAKKPAAAKPAKDPQAIRDALAEAERALGEAKRKLDEAKAREQEARHQKELADRKAERARSEQKIADLEKQIRDKLRQLQAALENVEEKRAAAASGSEAAQALAQAFGWIRSAAIKLGSLLAGDLGEAIAELATLQLEIGQQILENLPGLVPQIEGLTQNPDGTLSFNRAGQILIHELVEAINALIKCQRELKGLVDALKSEQSHLETLNQQIATLEAAR